VADRHTGVARDRHRKRSFDTGSRHFPMDHVGRGVRSDGKYVMPIRDGRRVQRVQHLVDLGGRDELSIDENTWSVDRPPRVPVRG
jgi:hypothetical protein